MERLDELRIDGDDLDHVLLEIERSFGVSLPRDLRHVRTAGDLFAEIRRVREPDGLGDRCETAMAFFLLRRMLAPLGLPPEATPRSPLANHGLPRPRRLARRIRTELGLEVPGIVISRTGCYAALVILAAGIGAALWAWSPQWLWICALILPLVAIESGGWDGDWKTLGSLARSVAARNVTLLAEGGARNREVDWWRSFSRLVASIAMPGRGQDAIDARQIGPDTRFQFD